MRPEEEQPVRMTPLKRQKLRKTGRSAIRPDFQKGREKKRLFRKYPDKWFGKKKYPVKWLQKWIMETRRPFPLRRFAPRARARSRIL